MNYTVTDILEPGESQNCKIQVSEQGATIQVRILNYQSNCIQPSTAEVLSRPTILDYIENERLPLGFDDMIYFLKHKQ